MESSGNYRSQCPIRECDHRIIGLRDEDEWTDLLDEHLRDEHDTTLYEWYDGPDTDRQSDGGHE